MKTEIEKPWLLYWVKKLQNDDYWKDIRFKKLKEGYPPFTIPNHLIDEVELDEFLKYEHERIPFFIGSQFGINPRLEEIYEGNAKLKFIAVLKKSLLSGSVAGLSIYLLSGNDLQQIEYFKN